ncbi:regulatory protein, gntR family [Collimonas sp. OK607]|uniref:FadR/GntR family transcriptional regulator n=1 Tax=Collimonas sp. OK607 TaxID=1798194 RepID=UPI0008ED9D5D|nr:FadR/GntR family transcriptional regulator [Collimonas sp. OK607]SFB06279.1 regulatory protein, gntR family [Collimonas sp. OK607]
MTKSTTPPVEFGAPAEMRLYRIVAGQIQQMIRDQKILPGTRLPSERDLSTQLDVSRASVREALIALELTGVIEVRGGSGIYVNEKTDAPADIKGAGCGPFEVLSARRLIEGEVAAMAAKMATDSAVDAIMQTVSDMERFSDDRVKNEQADRAFHMAIATATGNSALILVLSNLWDERGHLWSKMEEHFHTEDLRRETLTDHRRILEAIAARDPAGARRAMRAHLERVTREFSRGWGVKGSARVPDKKTD